ncbi:glycosyltransferase family 2 protein [Demequina sp. NBRC 110053]|uniref:glycosyltransferase n=1 Tax=Demequina sp. NBRC 110053 TaxID=1570342 RepID=UPI000A00AD5B|nr:glycosyltransferase family A protein [Demequina sp. NBRC 110053]
MRASVIIAALDAESTLGEQLEALVSQRVTVTWEVLVCDNGSRDGTVAVARGFADRLPLTVVDASARRGPAAARNIGAEHATGNVLLFCDADDVVADGWAHAMIAALASAPVVCGRLEWARLNTHYADRGPITAGLFTFDWLPALAAGSSNNLGVRAHAFAQVGGFEEALRVGEDVDLCWRLQLAGFSISEAPTAVVHARERQTLRGVWRQARSYGSAERRLAARYEPVRRAYDRNAVTRTAVPHAPTTSADAPSPRALPSTDLDAPVDHGGGRRLLARAVRLRRPRDLVYTVRRLGRAFGFRRAALDPDIPVVSAPERLPAPHLPVVGREG